MASPTGLWTSVSGSVAQSQALDVAANNLANVNTTGFKKDEPIFKEYLSMYERPPSPELDIPQTVFKDSDFYHNDGREHAMVNVDSIATDHSQGTFKLTNGPFDVAIEGPGFFVVQTPQGNAYTRAGDFKVDGNGFLVTTDGYRVLSAAADANAPGAAAPVAQQAQVTAPGNANRAPANVNPFAGPLPPINLADVMGSGIKPTITGDGRIFMGTQEVAQIAVAEFTNPKLLAKEGSTLYTNPSPANVARAAQTSTLHQGFIEGSNVNAVSEIMNVIKANRLFESNMRAMRTYNDMAGKEANEVGKL